MDGVAAGLLVALQLEQTALFGLEQEIVEGLETVRAFVKSRPLPLHRLLHERAVNLIIFAPLRAQGVERFREQIERFADRRRLRLLFTWGLFLLRRRPR